MNITNFNNSKCTAARHLLVNPLSIPNSHFQLSLEYRAFSEELSEAQVSFNRGTMLYLADS